MQHCNKTHDEDEVGPGRGLAARVPAHHHPGRGEGQNAAVRREQVAAVGRRRQPVVRVHVQVRVGHRQQARVLVHRGRHRLCDAQVADEPALVVVHLRQGQRRLGAVRRYARAEARRTAVGVAPVQAKVARPAAVAARALHVGLEERERVSLGRRQFRSMYYRYPVRKTLSMLPLRDSLSCKGY